MVCGCWRNATPRPHCLGKRHDLLKTSNGTKTFMDVENGDLAFLPLGGTGEIGMNLNLYRYGEPGKERWLAVDCGIGFGGSEHPEVDVMMADPGFIAAGRVRVVGVGVTP